MDYTEEQRVKYVAYKFSGEARRCWYAKRNSLVMELGSEEAITWIQFKEEFYQEYSWSLRKSTPQKLRSNKKQSRWCHKCGKLHFWEMQIKEEFVLQMWQGETLHSELQPGQKEWYWST